MEEVTWDGKTVTLRIGNEALAQNLANHLGEGEVTPLAGGYWLFAATFQVPEALQPYLPLPKRDS